MASRLPGFHTVSEDRARMVHLLRVLLCFQRRPAGIMDESAQRFLHAAQFPPGFPL